MCPIPVFVTLFCSSFVYNNNRFFQPTTTYMCIQVLFDLKLRRYKETHFIIYERHERVWKMVRQRLGQVPVFLSIIDGTKSVSTTSKPIRTCHFANKTTERLLQSFDHVSVLPLVPTAQNTSNKDSYRGHR